jgi:RNA polymerase sigma-70 factor (ECF subfamily)
MTVAAPAFEKIFRERRDFFLRVLARRVGNAHVAEEILQDAFLQVSRMDSEEVIANPDGYLMKVAINLSTDWMRHESSRRRRERDWVQSNTLFQTSGEATEGDPAADQILIAKDEWARLGRLVETLSPPVRTAFILHKVKGLSHEETARMMGLSKSTVEKHIMKAMRRVLELAADAPGRG